MNSVSVLPILLGFLVAQSSCAYVASYGTTFRCCRHSGFFGCDGKSVWLKDNTMYLETADNSLRFQDIAEEEGYWQCSFKDDNSSFSPWSDPRPFFVNGMTQNHQQVVLDASSTSFQYAHNLSLGRLTLKMRIHRVSIFCNGSSLLSQDLPSNYSLNTSLSNNGNSITLRNFTVTLNRTELIASLGEKSEVTMKLQIRLRETHSPIVATAHLIFDCREKRNHNPATFELNFTSSCDNYKDGRVIEYLLAEKTCLKSNISTTVICHTSQSGVLLLDSVHRIHIQSIQRALETIAAVSPWNSATPSNTPPRNGDNPVVYTESGDQSFSTDAVTHHDNGNNCIVEIYSLGILLKVIIGLFVVLIVLLLVHIISVWLQLVIKLCRLKPTTKYSLPVQQVSSVDQARAQPTFTGSDQDSISLQSWQQINHECQPKQTDDAHVRTFDEEKVIVIPNGRRRNPRGTNTNRVVAEAATLDEDFDQIPLANFNSQAGEGNVMDQIVKN